jgi:4'-phosphopantetheinyl transferase
LSGANFTVYLYPEAHILPRSLRLLDAAARYTGRETAGWQKAVEPRGRPFFRQAPDVHFSISHSGAFWACALGASLVGLDIQRQKTCDAPMLSRRFFHPQEDAVLAAGGYALPTFFEIWTAKESFVKYTGEGILFGLDTFDVTGPLPQGAQLRLLSAPPGYSMCLCAARIDEVTVIRL